jgi:DNA-binding Lrp family transcriptional regulator
MDELDVKILRSLISERAVSPSKESVKLSLRGIAARVGADDTTVNYRYKKLVEAGCMSIWSLLVNPAFLGYKVTDVMVDVQPEAAKLDMIRKLKLVHEITGMVNFYGNALSLYVIYKRDESKSRTIELISRITNAENISQSRMPMPPSLTKNLSEADHAIIRALSKDARKSTVLFAKQVGFSTKTVRKRVDKLRRENTILPLPILNIASIPGIIPAYLSYVYTKNEVKTSVDHDVVSQFDDRYIMGNFADPVVGQVVIGAPTMADVPRVLEWAKSQPGIANARINIATETFMFPEKIIELLEREKEEPLREEALA